MRQFRNTLLAWLSGAALLGALDYTIIGHAVDQSAQPGQGAAGAVRFFAIREQ